jgi:hypothetical protein
MYRRVAIERKKAEAGDRPVTFQGRASSTPTA